MNNKLLSNHKKVTITSGTVSRINMDGTVVIIGADDDLKIYKLSGLCADVWEFIKKENNIQKLVELVHQKYELPESRFESDLEDFFKRFSDLKLLKLE